MTFLINPLIGQTRAGTCSSALYAMSQIFVLLPNKDKCRPQHHGTLSWQLQVTERAGPVRWFQLQNSWAVSLRSHKKINHTWQSYLRPMSNRCHTFLTAGVSHLRKEVHIKSLRVCVCGIFNWAAHCAVYNFNLYSHFRAILHIQ